MRALENKSVNCVLVGTCVLDMFGKCFASADVFFSPETNWEAKFGLNYMRNEN